MVFMIGLDDLCMVGTVVLNGGQVGGIPNLALNSILMVLVHLNVHQ